ncbi:MAG TPA: biotin--[acetyl-CoA-carboxylase] ligase [Candidatus Dorea intestinavium]|nr:biotin--[acetyl-CoA-carboxylase] ligase [Candidatus Dorea intestinavium]
MLREELGELLDYHRELDSTNKRARDLGNRQAPDGMVVVTDVQTKGVGRRGRGWEGEPGKNISMSVLLYPKIAPNEAPMLTLVMALAVVKAIKKVTGIQTKIKWPNDIIAGHKKLCGILTEMKMAENQVKYVVIGVGLNTNQVEFSPEVKDKATSLAKIKKQSFNKEELILEILRTFEPYYNHFLEELSLNSLKEEYNKLLINKDKRLRIKEEYEEYEAYGIGINDAGHLLVGLDNGTTKELLAGEVSVRGLFGYV